MVNGSRVNSNRFPDKVADERFLPNSLLQVLRTLVPDLIEIVLAIEKGDFIVRILRKTHHVFVRFRLGSHAGFVGDNHCQDLRQGLSRIKDCLSQEIIEVLAGKHFIPQDFGILVSQPFAFFKELFDNGDICKTDFLTLLREQCRKLAFHLKIENPEQRQKDDAEPHQCQHRLFERKPVYIESHRNLSL